MDVALDWTGCTPPEESPHATFVRLTHPHLPQQHDIADPMLSSEDRLFSEGRLDGIPRSLLGWTSGIKYNGVLVL